ncbi:DALR anticodon-binding domain-containing protein [Calothrix sp. UHCC 0171]|uniref:DALR anticodon-binding domain-containing protein n=1 Tax=Calothrix sp. UHCC 0171 TaxID=3110245 RepID=UPI002B20FC5E|nr:DALR anticodon-binding domain-containing protein [Calothrix sp. UHCC 0171]MEA5572206.1 DALR anticodon-binding domain-containing protein [Calothrix sp. UHCC 0171]
MLLVSKYTAIRRLVNSYLQESLSIYAGYAKNLYIPAKENFVYQSRDKSKVLYISGIALKLAKSQQWDASEIANQIASHFLRNCDKSFRVEVLVPAWIRIQVADTIVATCLQSLVEFAGEQASFFETSITSPILPTTDSVFLVQYAHARCCSLLGLAQRQGLIQIDRNLQIPWLIKDGVSDDKFRCTDVLSRCLIGELVTVLDDLADINHSDMGHWQKAAISISKVFEDFWRSCRIWGEVKINSPELALARLGLVLVTQVILQFLLENKLGVSALREL